MKKLLTLLLTLVLAICLINLNNSFVIAEESNDGVTGGLIFKSDGVYDSSNTKITDLSSVGVSDYTTSGATIALDITDSVRNLTGFQIKTDSSFTLNVNPTGDTLSIKGGTNERVVGLRLENASTINSNGKTLNVIAQSSKGAALYGKSLTINNTNVVATANTADDDSQATVACDSDLTLSNNSKLTSIQNGLNQNNAGAIDVFGNLTIDDGCTLEAQVTNASNSHGAIYVNGTFTYPDTYEIKGTADGSKEETNLVEVVFDDTSDYFVMKNDISTKAKYVIIRPKQEPEPTPTPTPSPSKKDESCEKVIGPTWHWNNDKGICEEYATVGTATR